MKKHNSEFVWKGSLSKRRLASLVLVLCIFSAVVSGTFVYVLANPGVASTYYVEEGIYPGAADYTLWREGSTVYSKDANGHIIYTTSNASYGIISTFASASDGDTVYLKAASYPIDTEIWVNKSLTIVGDGVDATILYDDTTGFGSQWFTVHASHVRVEGITFDGNAVSDAIFHVRRYSGDDDIHGIRIRNCEFKNPALGHDAGGLFCIWDTEQSDYRLYDVQVIGCIFTDDEEETYDNVAISYVKDIVVQNCWINLTKTFILYKSRNCLVAGCTFRNFHAYASLVVGLGKHRIIGNQFLCTYPMKVVAEDYPDAGLTVIDSNFFNNSYLTIEDVSGKLSNLIVSNNVFAYSDSLAIEIDGQVEQNVTNIVIDANTIYYSTSHGIYLQNATNIAITNNVLNDIGQGAGTYRAIYLYESENCTVANNIISDIDDDGIYLNNADNNIISGNQIRNCVSRGIYEVGTSDYNVVTSCIAMDCSMGISISGAHSYVCCSYNGTTWISEYPAP